MDLELRNFTYGLFVDLGRAPTVEEAAQTAGASVAEVEAGWRRLHDAHALVLSAGTAEIRMANPFSAVPTAHRVQAAGRWWYANCAWDAFGICAALHADGRVETSCPDCGEPIAVEVRDERSEDESLLFHCLVPAERHVTRWLGEREPGATITVGRLSELAHAWWSDRLAPDWRPHTRKQNQAILDRLGLTGEFWRLP